MFSDTVSYPVPMIVRPGSGCDLLVRLVSLLVALLALTAPVHAEEFDRSLVQRGRYLAIAGDCISCHTRAGGAPFAGGLALHTPFGTLYSTNITPDPQTGIGSWSEAEFARALRQGIGRNGEHLYPVFPYPYFTKISDADVAALYAFLRAIPAVKHVAPANDMTFPFGERRLLGVWKALYFQEGRFTADAGKSAQWNRGAYLVEGLGHCSACHTPRNSLGGEKADQLMTGGVYQESLDDQPIDWSAVNLTSGPNGLQAWPVQDLTNYLKLGFSPHASVSGPMISVVMNSTRSLTREDDEAIATYLKAMAPNRQNDAHPPSDRLMKAGEPLYSIHCGTCHLPTGLGSDSTAPPLAGSAVVLTPNPASMINIVLRGPILPDQAPSPEWQNRKWQAMPAFGGKLSDADAAALLSYVRGSWGNKEGAVTEDQIARQR
ncbi:MAG TPA: cytochrome c [Steroidobacteraceae bacterium]